MEIFLCADSQNTLKALAGGPTAGREYIKGCLEDVNILRQEGSKIRGKWTPFHTGIEGNEEADTLAKEGAKENPCRGRQTRLTWLRARPHHSCAEAWQARHKLSTKPNQKPYGPTSKLNRGSARVVARMRPSLTTADHNPMKQPTRTSAGKQPNQQNTYY